MANIISVSPLASWFLREQPVSSKFNSELKNKMNSLISNHVIINNGLEQLIQGASGGTCEQYRWHRALYADTGYRVETGRAPSLSTVQCSSSGG